MLPIIHIINPAATSTNTYMNWRTNSELLTFFIMRDRPTSIGGPCDFSFKSATSPLSENNVIYFKFKEGLLLHV